MATKVPKACQDSPVGYQSINTIGANIDEAKENVALEHQPADNDWAADDFTIGGTPNNFAVGSAPTGPAAAAGAHETSMIGRGVVYATTLTGGPTAMYAAYSSGALQTMQILDTGKFFFPITGFTKVWGFATIFGDATGLTRFPRVQPSTQSGTGTVGLLVTTFEIGLSTNADPPVQYSPIGTFFGRVNLGFYLIAYGIRSAYAEPARVEPPRARPWMWKPKMFIPRRR